MISRPTMVKRQTTPLVSSRVNAGYTQQQLADKLGVNYASIKRWEDDPGSIKLKNLDAWYKALNDEGKKDIRRMVDQIFVA